MFAALSAAMTVMVALMLRPARRARRALRGRGAVRVVKPVGAGSRAALRVVRVPSTDGDAGEAVAVRAAQAHNDPAGRERVLRPRDACHEARRRGVVARGRRALPGDEVAGLAEVGLVAGAVLRRRPLHVGDPAAERRRVRGGVGLAHGHAPLAHQRGGVEEPAQLEVRVAPEAAVVARVQRLVHAEEARVARAAQVPEAALGDGGHHGQLVRHAAVRGATGHPAGESLAGGVVAGIDRGAGLAEVGCGRAAAVLGSRRPLVPRQRQQ